MISSLRTICAMSTFLASYVVLLHVVGGLFVPEIIVFDYEFAIPGELGLGVLLWWSGCRLTNGKDIHALGRLKIPTTPLPIEKLTYPASWTPAKTRVF